MSQLDKIKIQSLLSPTQDDSSPHYRSENELKAVFDEIECYIGIYEDNRINYKDLPKRSDRKKQLQKFSQALKTLLRPSVAVELSFSGMQQYRSLMESAAWLSPLVDKILSEPVKKGPEADDRVWLIGQLMKIFQRETGREGSSTYNSKEEVWGGDLFDFIWATGVPIKENELANTITKVRKSKKAT